MTEEKEKNEPWVYTADKIDQLVPDDLIVSLKMIQSMPVGLVYRPDVKPLKFCVLHFNGEAWGWASINYHMRLEMCTWILQNSLVGHWVVFPGALASFGDVA